MAMSGADGKSFSLNAKSVQGHLSGAPLGLLFPSSGGRGMLKLNKILPPLIVVSVVGVVAYMAVKKIRGE